MNAFEFEVEGSGDDSANLLQSIIEWVSLLLLGRDYDTHSLLKTDGLSALNG